MRGLDTHTHTHTQDNYSNPRCACAPRVNKPIHVLQYKTSKTIPHVRKRWQQARNTLTTQQVSIDVPSTALEEKKAKFLDSNGLSLVQSTDLGSASDSPVKELLSTWKKIQEVV